MLKGMMERNSAMERPGEPDMHAHAASIFGFIFCTPFFSLAISQVIGGGHVGHWTH